MKHSVFFACALVTFFGSLAHSSALDNPLDAAMTKRAVTCYDIRYNAINHIVRYFAEGKMDSVDIVKSYWQEKCGQDEALFRLEILQRLMQRRPIDELLDSSSIGFILLYKNGRRAMQRHGQRRVRRWYPQGANLDSLTMALANAIEKDKLQKAEKMLVTLYQDSIDAFFEMVYRKQIDNAISQMFWSAVQEARDEADLSMGFMLGGWIPLGNTKVIGEHPLFGFYIGGRHKRIIAEADLNFRFLKAKKEYTVEQNGTDYTTDHFFGGYIGADISCVLLKNRHNSINLLTGIAFDGWDALQKDEANGVTAQGVNGLNLNVGLGYQRFYSTFGNIGTDLRYNFNNYGNQGGTDFSGNTVTAVVKWGFFGNASRIYRYKELEYNGPGIWK